MAVCSPGRMRSTVEDLGKAANGYPQRSKACWNPLNSAKIANRVVCCWCAVPHNAIIVPPLLDEGTASRLARGCLKQRIRASGVG